MAVRMPSFIRWRRTCHGQYNTVTNYTTIHFRKQRVRHGLANVIRPNITVQDWCAQWKFIESGLIYRSSQVRIRSSKIGQLTSGRAYKSGLEYCTELSVGLFSSTQPNPTHQITDPTQPNPLPGEIMDPWPNPTHTQPNPHTSNNNWPTVRK